MSTTPRTDAARGFHDMDTAVSAEDMAQLETELAAAKLEADGEARWALEYLARAERAEAEVERLNKRIKDDNRSYGCELRDPYGTIWEQAAKDGARAEKAEAELAKRDSEYLRGTKMVVESASVWQTRAEKAEAKIITARSALFRIANSDYRGNRSLESQIAFAALEEIK